MSFRAVNLSDNIKCIVDKCLRSGNVSFSQTNITELASIINIKLIHCSTFFSVKAGLLMLIWFDNFWSGSEKNRR